MVQIQPQHITLGSLLYGRLFRIPPYQRAYTWHTKQRLDLFDDIRHTWSLGIKGHHFMATVVGLRRESRTIITDEHHVIEIVDGQQRITTLILLFKAIAEALDRSDPVAERVGRELDEMLVKPDDASLLLLQTNHDSGNHFANYMRDGVYADPQSASILADIELLSAIEECENFVIDWETDIGSLADLVGLMKNRISFIFHELADESLVYSVFEVLNSRGLDVSWFDRLKSMLMSIIFESETGNKTELIDEIHVLWSEIYARVGLRLGLSTESLRFTATLRDEDRPNRPMGAEEAVQLLVKQSKSGPPSVIETTQRLKVVTEAVDELVADNRINAVTQIAQARLVAVAINLRSDLNEVERNKVMRHWENVTFRIFGMYGKDARTAVGDYVRLAWSINNQLLTCEEIMGRLQEIGSEYPIEDAVDYLSGEDCYNEWQQELRYFFFRYEEYLARVAGQKFDNEQWNRIWLASASTSIEHIRPQSRGSEKLVHRLGNLLVLPPRLNSQLGAKSPKDKAAAYQKTGLLVAQDVADRINVRWGRSEINEREDELLEWALKEWGD